MLPCRKIPTFALIAVVVIAHVLRAQTEATFENYFQKQGYLRDHRIPEAQADQTSFNSIPVHKLTEQLSDDKQQKLSFDERQHHKRPFMRPYERDHERGKETLCTSNKICKYPGEFADKNSSKRSFDESPHKRSFMRQYQSFPEESGNEMYLNSFEEEKQELIDDQYNIDMPERRSPLLKLYSSSASRRFSAMQNKELGRPALSSLTNKHMPSEIVSSEQFVSVGAVFDRPLNKNDTHHFYWRLLTEGGHASSGRHGFGTPNREEVGVSPEEEEEEEERDTTPLPAAVRCEVHSRGNAPMPWIAVGFSDRGELPGADLCVFWTDWKDQVHFQSAFVDSSGRMVTGSPGVCLGFRYRRQRGLLKFTFYRKLDTCLPRHYVIERGTTHLVWSYGRGPLYQLSGVLAAGEESGSVMLELLKPSFDQQSPPQPFNELKVMSEKVSVPTQETTYWCTVRKLPEHFQRKHHMIMYRPAIEEKNKDIVHHMEVFHCEHPPHVVVPLYTGPCDAEDRPSETDACKRVLSAWAMGAMPFTYPQEAGLPIGGPDFNPYIMLEVHYNNPLLYSGRVDSSGMSLLYTSQLRPHDASIMELGLEYSDKMAIPPHSPSFILSGYCVPECTALGLPAEGIFIFGSQLHTHLTGVRAWTSRYRNGRQLSDLNRDNHYSTRFQEIRRLPEPVHVLPGDSLVTSCEHSTLGRENATMGGFSITDEMCVNYIHYYPKVELEVCKSSVDTQALVDYFHFMNKYDLQDTSPSKGWSDNYRSIEWTPLRADFLADMYASAPLSMQCNKSSGARFPGYWDGIVIPKVTHELPAPHRKCEHIETIKNDGQVT
uniref:Dopamine beta-hydroxylase-like n=3 Tax=Hirondellea gigas TaxID=1518452 RepID=A0A6A7FUT6_9CRUS